MSQAICLKEKFALIDGYWQPKIIGELNGQYVKLAKFKGEMIWHSHEFEDEYFQVVAGEITIGLKEPCPTSGQLIEKTVTLKQGECLIVPKGVEHKPQAHSEAHVLMFEPKSTAHTGDIDSEITVATEDQDWI